MNTLKFIQQLRLIAEEPKPLTLSASSSAATWDGTRYAKGGATSADPVALVWWSILTAIAELVEGQESPLTTKQMEYLMRLLFGGMGSLNDVSFAQSSIDRSLDEKRRLLFAAFSE
jgi:hypothetical protein